MKIGIVGCGAIGGSIAKAIQKDFKGQAILVSLFDTNPAQAARLSTRICGNKRLAARDLTALIAKSGLIVECASAKASWDIASAALRKGKDVLIMSVGGIIAHGKELSALAENSNGRVYIPSGALAGIDALKAARMGKIKSVTLTTYKNPRAFKGVAYIEERKIPLDGLKKNKILFCGNAEDAVQYFPQNINVAAVLSLAGVGKDNTRVRIIASPFVRRNIHEVRIDAAAGTIVCRTENVLHPENPKTSYLAVLAAVATLKNIFAPVKIGT